MISMSKREFDRLDGRQDLRGDTGGDRGEQAAWRGSDLDKGATVGLTGLQTARCSWSGKAAE
jgi:hypothetical protein